jgi:heat-inducible transcriptional repressor
MLASGHGLQSVGQAAQLELSLMRREVEEAVRRTTETLSQVTNLLAVVSAPALNTASIRHVEVLALQPRVVVVVIITSTGSVSKMMVTFEHAVDPGLVTWAGECLNERLVGTGLGARMLHQRLIDSGLSATEVAFLRRLAPAFGEIDLEGEDALYVEGTAHLFSTGMIEDTAQINELMSLLERRRSASRGCTCGSATRTRFRRCTPSDWSRPATVWPGASWARCR